MQLRALHRDAELADQIERVVAAQAGEIEILREDQHAEDDERADHAPARQSGPRFPAGRGRLMRRPRPVHRRPAAHPREQDDRDERQQRAPCEARLAARHDDERREQRAERRSQVAADLEHRLRQAVAPARRHPRDPRRLGMKDRRSDAHQPGRHQDRAEGRRHRQQQQADQRERHPRDERIRRRPAVGIHADDRLQQRRRQLQRERDEPDLREVQLKRRLQDRIDRRNQRLDRVVQQMRHADRRQDADDGGARGPRRAMGPVCRKGRHGE